MESINSFYNKIINRQNKKKVHRMTYDVDSKDFLKACLIIGKARNKKFTIDDENKFVYENIIKWLLGQDFKCIDIESKKIKRGRKDAGLFIAGNTGSGKSWAVEILSEIAKEAGVCSGFGSQKGYMYFNCCRTDDICTEYSLNGNLSIYENTRIVCFDDLCSDSEPLESLFMGNRLNVMQKILEHRGDRKDKITIITSNVPFNHEIFIDRYGDRVVSRLHEACNYFELKGRDRRRE